MPLSRCSTGSSRWHSPRALTRIPWCATCRAHSNQIVCNLAKDCEGQKATYQEKRLGENRHPYTGSRLDEEARRLRWHDLEATRLLAQVLGSSTGEDQEDGCSSQEECARNTFADMWAHWEQRQRAESSQGDDAEIGDEGVLGVDTRTLGWWGVA